MVTIKDILKIAFILTQLNNYGAENASTGRYEIGRAHV